MLTRDQILAASDLPSRAVAVPEWGGDVRLVGLTAAERDAYEGEVAGQRDSPALYVNFRARLVARCLVGEDGVRLFERPEDVVALGSKSGAVVDRLFDVCQELSGLGQDVDANAKNSGSALSGASGSDWPETSDGPSPASSES